MNIEDAPRSGRPVITDVDQITVLIDSDRQITVREIAAIKNWQVNCFRTFKQTSNDKEARCYGYRTI